jgi:hypothetical protein
MNPQAFKMPSLSHESVRVTLLLIPREGIRAGVRGIYIIDYILFYDHSIHFQLQ